MITDWQMEGNVHTQLPDDLQESIWTHYHNGLRDRIYRPWGAGGKKRNDPRIRLKKKKVANSDAASD